MSAQATHATAAGLVVVHVREELNPALAGHPGHHYDSPPQPRPAALELVEVLLGRPTRDGETRWVRPIAGGRRTITITPPPDACRRDATNETQRKE